MGSTSQVQQSEDSSIQENLMKDLIMSSGSKKAPVSTDLSPNSYHNKVLAQNKNLESNGL